MSARALSRSAGPADVGYPLKNIRPPEYRARSDVCSWSARLAGFPGLYIIRGDEVSARSRLWAELSSSSALGPPILAPPLGVPMRRLAVSLSLATLTAASGAIARRRSAMRRRAGQRVAEVAVRLDAPSGGTPSASVLAYRAGVHRRGMDDVLSVIDPLVAAPPEAGCVRRDVAVRRADHRPARGQDRARGAGRAGAGPGRGPPAPAAAVPGLPRAGLGGRRRGQRGRSDRLWRSRRRRWA